MSKVRMRYCCICGDMMGVIEAKYYDSRDTCGKMSCDREMRDAQEAERAEAHEQLDRDRGYGEF
jgi:hypothetical protein